MTIAGGNIKKQHSNPNAARRPRSPQGAGAESAPGTLRSEPPRYLRSAQPRPGGRRRRGGVRACRERFLVLYKNLPACPQGKPPRTVPSSSGTRTPVRCGGGAVVTVPQQPPGRAEPRSRMPLPCLSPVPRFSFSFSPDVWKESVLLLRPFRGLGRGHRSLPRLPAPGAAALCGRWVRGARRRGRPGVRAA